MTELCDLNATVVRRLIGAKQISPVELLESCIGRIEKVDPAVNAIPATCFERARAEAKTAEQAVMQGEALGPLHGLPVGVKDLQLTEGVVTTFGSPLYRDHVPEQDEQMVANVRSAGGIIIGKTNTPEFGAGANTTNRVYGPSRNPFDTARICGGSSGGSAVALACGMMPLATGSDMGGSLRTPAAFCGVVGFRPTPGLIPAEQRGVGWSPLGVQGPMGRTVEDACLLMSAMAGPDPKDPLSFPFDGNEFALPKPADLASLRVAFSENLGFAPVSQSIRYSFRQATQRIADVFATADNADPDLHDANDIFEALRALHFLVGHKQQYDTARDQLGPNIIANVEQGLGYDIMDLARATASHTVLYRRFLDFMKVFDVLICPAVSVPPFPVEQLYLSELEGQELRTYFHWIAITYGLTLTAHPVIVVPCGRDQTGTPFGLQICGHRGQEARLLAIAAALEAHLQTIPELARPVPDLDKLAASEGD